MIAHPCESAKAADAVAPQLPLEHDDEDDAGATGEGESPAESTYPYETEIVGLAPEEQDLKDLLEQTSQLIALADRPPLTEAALRRRAQDDVSRLKTALQSKGFYDATVDFTLEPPETEKETTEKETENAPAHVTVKVITGTVYLLSKVDIVYREEISPEAENIPRGAGDLGLNLGMRAEAKKIQGAQRRLLEALENNGYPRAEVAERRAVIDRSSTTLRVVWEIAPGSFLHFGDMEIAGLESVEEKYIRSFRTWTPGAIYDRSEVEDVRRELSATELFQSIQVTMGEVADGRAPVAFTFEEGPRRSIGFGARFSTSEGPSVTAFWEHRNVFGQNERIRLETEVGLIEQRFTADLRKPRFRRNDQTLINTSEFRRHETDAFEEMTLGNTLSLEREFNETWTGSTGGSVEFTRQTDNEGERDFILFGLPNTLIRDTRDDPLDPTEGTRLEIATTPYLATLDSTQPFLRNSVGGSAYYAVDSDDRFVLAGRARIGSIVGAETEEIPASKRFYAGGGGSIRGYQFETVGPLDNQDDPLGGRSLVELGLELRVRITDSIGLVPFVDAGNVYDSVLPDFSQDEPLRYAAGLGVRYYTGIGPLRLDIAVPLNKRNVDNDFEIYISLGQAF